MSIFPYIYYMISSFDITTDDRQIAIYAGLVTSSFAFAEFSTGVLWGRLSDKIGRKPVLIGGLVGTAISMIMFGFSKSLPMALLARAMGGLLNGNIGVIQTTVAEMITVKEHQPRAYSIMPFVWCLGSILGPALGGALAQPCISYPKWFAPGGLFDEYPFLLSNLVCAIILLCGIINGLLFLKETHPEKKGRTDWGLKLGESLASRFSSSRDETRPTDVAPPLLSKHAAESSVFDAEAHEIEDDDPPPGYRTAEDTPRASQAQDRSSEKRIPVAKKRAATKAFTKQIILIVIGFGLLAFHTISYDQLLPIFLSSPISHESPSLPFKFVGGFALSTKTIGVLFSIQGLYSMAAQIFLFPYIVKRIGALSTLRWTLLVWPILYIIVPYLVLLPKWLQFPGILFCLTWRITAQVLAYPATAILLANSAPSTTDLGLINGVGASAASLARAFGPTASGLIHAWGLAHGYSGIAFWFGGLICLLGAIESRWVQEPASTIVTPEEGDEDEESALTGAPALDAALTAVSKSSDNLLALAAEQEIESEDES